ncbi:MAG: DUF4065 domain-containing protein [Sphingomonadales bacterium]|nr:MAG: DUF4065 domain-containing protein [Sphingomonadales bacterium]
MSRVNKEHVENKVANEKLKEALHFVIECCDDSSRLGAVRLNKILWFSDCHSYREHGASITADGYVKRRFGPVPKRVLAATRELEEESKIAIREVPYSSRKSFREFISLKQPEHSALSEQDMAVLKAYTTLICNEFSAAQISDLSHDQVWEAADEGEEIPLYTIFASVPGAITDEVRSWANKVALANAA